MATRRKVKGPTLEIDPDSRVEFRVRNVVLWTHVRVNGMDGQLLFIPKVDEVIDPPAKQDKTP